MSKKGGGAGQTYNYYGTLVGMLCIGPGEDLVSILLNGEEVWPKGIAWAVGLAIIGGQLYVFDAQTWICTSNHVASNANAPGSGLEGWTEFTFTRTTEATDDFTLTASDGTVYGLMTLLWGTTAQVVDNFLKSTGNDGGIAGNFGNGDQHPDYEDMVGVILKDFLLGQEIQSGPNIEIVIRRKPNQAVITDAAAGITDGQANLMAVAAEWITNENCLGQDVSLIDATSFIAVADWLQTNQDKYGASVLIDTLETIGDLFDSLMQMIDGYVRFNPVSKKIEVGVYQHGVVPTIGSYVTLTADSFTKIPKFTANSWQETFNCAVVNFQSRQLNYQQTSSPPAVDPRGFFVLGEIRPQTLDRPWITRDAQALIHARETLRVIGHAQMSGELEVRREIGRNIRPGDYVLVDVDLEPGMNSLLQFFRVTQTKMAQTGPVTLNVFADNTLAAVPWNNSATPVLVGNSAVPPITSFRFLEVPTVLSGERGEIIVLAARPSNLIAGAALYFDTDPAGTFSLLGTFGSFAAKATLRSNLAATDATLHLTVDTTQADADYFTQEYTAKDAVNDTMLAFILQTVSSGPDTGEVDESGGYQIMEICSVSTQTLVGAGQYDLTILRGRKNTLPAAFSTATAEVWLIPANLLAFFNHNLFETIRANRLLGLTPAYAQFRLCPYTFVASLPLSSATSEQFRFPLNSISAPSLALSAPASFAPAVYALTFPNRLNVAGVWTDPDQNLVEFEMTLQKSTDLVPRPVINQQFSPRGTYAFNSYISFDSTGTWVITLTARDSNNLSTSIQITATVTAPITAATTCAFPTFLDCNGNEIPVTVTYGGGIYTVTQSPKVPIPFGPITIKCSSPGSWCQFFTNGLVLQSGVLSNPSMPPAGLTYADDLQPFHGLFELGSPAVIQSSWTLQFCVLTTAPGYLNLGGISNPLSVVFDLVN
jgi:hypothetical protein